MTLVKKEPGTVKADMEASEVDVLYEDTVYMVLHWLGERESDAENNISRSQLLLYVQQVFNKSVDEHLETVNKVKKRSVISDKPNAPPTYTLSLEVIEARNLTAKDANGFSDPYCTFGVIYRSGNKEVTLHEWDSADKKRHGDANALGESQCLSSKFACMTKIKKKTLNPVWNESFTFDVTDIKNGTFHLAIWDYDGDLTVVDAVKTLHEVHTIKGVHRYLKQVVKSVKIHSGKEEESVDDFLGCVDISLRETSMAGGKGWFVLQNQPGSSNVSGHCHLSLNISAKKIVPTQRTCALKIQVLLLTILLRHELKVTRHAQHWSGALSAGATRVLSLYSLHTRPTTSQTAMARWIVYSAELCSRGAHCVMLPPLLEEMHRTWRPLDAQSEEAQLLRDSFTGYIDHLLSKLRQVQELPADAEDAADNLRSMLWSLALYSPLGAPLEAHRHTSVLAQIYKTEAFKQLCPNHVDLEVLIIPAIREGTESWYRTLTLPDKEAQEIASEWAVLRPQREKLKQLSSLVEAVTVDLSHRRRPYQELFPRSVNVNYFNLVYCLLEKLVADTVKRVAEDMSQLLKDAEDGHSDSDIGEMLFIVYVHLKELHALHEYVTDRDKTTLALFGFYKWFQPAMNKWFEVIQQKIQDRIRKAVSIDTLEVTDSLVSHSTSAVDTVTCLSQLGTFWLNLAWPEPLEAFILVTKLTQDICDASMVYARLIYQKLEKCSAEPTGAESKVSSQTPSRCALSPRPAASAVMGARAQLCTVVSDLDFVRDKLLLFPVQLGWQELASVIGDRSEQVQTALYGQLHGARDDLACQVHYILSCVPTRMLLDLKQRVSLAAKAPDSMQPVEALSPLIEYLEASLSTFDLRLSKERCIRMMQTMWTALLDILTDTVNSRHSNSVRFDVRFHYSLLALRETFHAGGEGMSLEVLESVAFQMLEKKLWLKTLSTVKLIEEFYLKRMEEQELCGQSSLGEVRVRCWYANSRLHVQVLNGTRLPAMDSNGLSDPFVRLELCPYHHFPLAKIMRTRTQSNTLHPIFDQTFEFSVSEEQCRSRSACVLITVMDFDLFVSDDYIGQAVLRLADVPCVEGHAATGLPQHSLPLMDKSIHADIDIIKILEERRAEKDVQEFLQKWK